MIPTLPKIVPRRVIALVILIILALAIGFTLSSITRNNPNFQMTRIFAVTPTPK
jgi:hypothetical protein